MSARSHYEVLFTCSLVFGTIQTGNRCENFTSFSVSLPKYTSPQHFIIKICKPSTLLSGSFSYIMHQYFIYCLRLVFHMLCTTRLCFIRQSFICCPLLFHILSIVHSYFVRQPFIFCPLFFRILSTILSYFVHYSFAHYPPFCHILSTSLSCIIRYYFIYYLAVFQIFSTIPSHIVHYSFVYYALVLRVLSISLSYFVHCSVLCPLFFYILSASHPYFVLSLLSYFKTIFSIIHHYAHIIHQSFKYYPLVFHILCTNLSYIVHYFF